MERDFYKSLSPLAKHYGIQPMQTQDFDFPYNLALAVSDMEEKLKQKVLVWEEIRFVWENKTMFFLSEERYNTGNTLFYIPVAPLYRLFRDAKRKANAELFLSVCSYLYHIAEVPSYRQQSSYLFWMYEMMSDWVEQDDFSEETKRNLAEIKQAEFIGDFIEKKIYNLKTMNLLNNRFKTFKVKDEFDKKCWEVAKEAFELYNTYPDTNIFRNAKPNAELKEDDFESIIEMNKYISFYADHKG